MYGKINEKGYLTLYDGKPVETGGRRYVNPNRRVLGLVGYKPIIPAEVPEVPRGMALTVDYVEDADCIRTVYGLIGGAL